MERSRPFGRRQSVDKAPCSTDSAKAYRKRPVQAQDPHFQQHGAVILHIGHHQNATRTAKADVAHSPRQATAVKPHFNVAVPRTRGGLYQ